MTDLTRNTAHTPAETKREKHTPGPWLVVEPGQYGHTKHRVGHVVGQERLGHSQGRDIVGAICDICINRSIYDKDISPTERANARLIAAAPELLEALREMLSLARDMFPGFINST